MPSQVELKPASDVLAGAVARAASQGTIHPIDTLKVRLQTRGGGRGPALGFSKLSKLVPPKGVFSLSVVLWTSLCFPPFVSLGWQWLIDAFRRRVCLLTGNTLDHLPFSLWTIRPVCLLLIVISNLGVYAQQGQDQSILRKA